VLQGSLRVESSPGQGLRYHLRFPRKTSRPELKLA
jgi:signal transduction histidine kinase